MAALRWTLEAEGALRDIYEYIAKDRPATALRTLESIVNKVESLAGYPRLGQGYHYHRQWRVHLLTYGHFRIAYLVDEDDDGITVLGVFHGMIFLPPK